MGYFHFLVIAINIYIQIFVDIFSFVSFLFLHVYQIQELNVRKVTLSTDKNKYGIRLRAEPDHMVLGKRLKGAFKMVMTSIRLRTQMVPPNETDAHHFPGTAPAPHCSAV